jgi:hypothetical protein
MKLATAALCTRCAPIVHHLIGHTERASSVGHAGTAANSFTRDHTRSRCRPTKPSFETRPFPVRIPRMKSYALHPAIPVPQIGKEPLRVQREEHRP